MADAARKAPTSADVARLAGVSRATVSYVINEVPDSRISEDTRDRVLAAVGELGYSPSSAARSLRAGQTDLVLLPAAHFPLGPAAFLFLDRLAENLSAAGLTLLLHAGRESRGTAAHWAQLRPAAVISNAARCDRTAAELLATAGVNALVILDEEPVDYAASIVFSQRTAGARAAEYLLGRGHRHLAATLVPTFEEISRPRAGGLVTAAHRAGARADLVELGDSPEAAAALARRWAADPDRPTAVLAYNDDYAMMLIHALQQTGLSVPGDVAVMGVDDLPLCEMTSPRLTSVAYDWAGMADVVSATVVALVQGTPKPEPGAEITLTVRPRDSA